MPFLDSLLGGLNIVGGGQSASQFNAPTPNYTPEMGATTQGLTSDLLNAAPPVSLTSPLIDSAQQQLLGMQVPTQPMQGAIGGMQGLTGAGQQWLNAYSNPGSPLAGPSATFGSSQASSAMTPQRAADALEGAVSTLGNYQQQLQTAYPGLQPPKLETFSTSGNPHNAPLAGVVSSGAEGLATGYTPSAELEQALSYMPKLAELERDRQAAIGKHWAAGLGGQSSAAGGEIQRNLGELGLRYQQNVSNMVLNDLQRQNAQQRFGLELGNRLTQQDFTNQLQGFQVNQALRDNLFRQQQAARQEELQRLEIGADLSRLIGGLSGQQFGQGQQAIQTQADLLQRLFGMGQQSVGTQLDVVNSLIRGGMAEPAYMQQAISPYATLTQLPYWSSVQYQQQPTDYSGVGNLMSNAMFWQLANKANRQ